MVNLTARPRHLQQGQEGSLPPVARHVDAGRTRLIAQDRQLGEDPQGHGPGTWSLGPRWRMLALDHLGHLELWVKYGVLSHGKPNHPSHDKNQDLGLCFNHGDD